jgi:hypothetical protein
MWIMNIQNVYMFLGHPVYPADMPVHVTIEYGC